jgi:hypothetical protein
MFVSGEAWQLFKEAHLEQDFSDFQLEVSLKFSMNCFDLSSFFLLRDDESPNTANSSSSRVLKTEPLSPITTGIDFAYARDIEEMMVATQDTLLDFRFRNCFSQCNYDDTISTFLCN